MSLLVSDAFAQSTGNPMSSGYSQIILVVFVAVFYFLLIRPQQKLTEGSAGHAVASGKR